MRRILLFITVAILAPATLQAQFGSISGKPSYLPQQLASVIKQKGYQRVGILPQFIDRDSDGESLHGATALQSKLYAERIAEGLLEQSGGAFQVVDSAVMSDAFGGVTIADLGQTSRVAEAARRAGGLNGIVVGVVTDERNLAPAQRSPNLRVTCRLIDVGQASQVAIKNEELPLTIADMAMMGESFELRRWVNGRIDNIALASYDSRTVPVEFSSVSRIGPADVNSRQHPLSDSSFPFPVQVMVDKQPRTPVFIKGKPYVTVDPGEEYSVRVRNNSGKDVYVAIFVDGINVLGKRREHVANCKYWHLAAGDTTNFRGWYSGSEGRYTEERFYIARRRETVAVKAGFGEDMGMITAAFYTVGAPATDPQRLAQAKPAFGEEGEWVQDPNTRQWRWKAKVRFAYSEAPSVASSAGSALGGTAPRASASHQFKAKAMAPQASAPGFGTGAGAQREVLVGQVQGGPVGLLLAAVTLYYRTTSELNAMK